MGIFGMQVWFFFGWIQGVDCDKPGTVCAEAGAGASRPGRGVLHVVGKGKPPLAESNMIKSDIKLTGQLCVCWVEEERDSLQESQIMSV